MGPNNEFACTANSSVPNWSTKKKKFHKNPPVEYKDPVAKSGCGCGHGKKLITLLICIVAIEILLQQEYWSHELLFGKIRTIPGEAVGKSKRKHYITDEELRIGDTAAKKRINDRENQTAAINMKISETFENKFVGNRSNAGKYTGKDDVLKTDNKNGFAPQTPINKSDMGDRVVVSGRDDKKNQQMSARKPDKKSFVKAKPSTNSSKKNKFRARPFSKRIKTSLRDPAKKTVTLASVMCGERLQEGLTMLKSAIFFGRTANLYLLIFTDEENRKALSEKIDEFTRITSSLKISLEYELFLIYTKPEDGEKWNSMFAPCATQRLFFPLTLPHIDRLMYVDTDILFLSSVTDLWDEFDHFESFQLAAMIAEHEEPGDGYYNRKSKTPYYGPRGLNSGVMLMNLDAMRSFEFVPKIISINSEYGSKLLLPDQDMLNILFKNNPSLLHQVGCEYNYRMNHCLCDFPDTGDCGCKGAEEKGISIFHGNRKVFHGVTNKQFRGKRLDFINNIYNTFNMLDLVKTPPTKVLGNMLKDYNDLKPNYACTSIGKALFTKFHKYVDGI